MNALTTFILYETFVQTWKKAIPEILHCQISNPTLDTKIKKFVSSSPDQDDDDEEYRDGLLDMSTFSAPELSVCAVAIEKFTDSPVSSKKVLDWLQDIKNGEWMR